MPSRLLRVLLVDGDPVLLRVHTRGLARSTDVVSASNGADAIELAMNSTFDAVITDSVMAPSEDGVWLLERMRMIGPTVRRVLTSARPIEIFAPSLRSGLVHVFVPNPATIENIDRNRLDRDRASVVPLRVHCVDPGRRAAESRSP